MTLLRLLGFNESAVSAWRAGRPMRCHQRKVHVLDAWDVAWRSIGLALAFPFKLAGAAIVLPWWAAILTSMSGTTYWPTLLWVVRGMPIQ